MHIGFVVDHPKRDLPGGVRLGHAAARRGMHVSLIPMYDQAVDVPLLCLDALIVNYARPANRDLLEGYGAFGLPVFVLDTEGGIMAEEGANSLKDLPRLVGENGVEKHLAGYLFWGSRQREAFAASGYFPASKLHVTGCPRFDFASAKWSAALKFPHSGHILVNTSFPLVNSRFSRSEEEEIQTMVQAGWEPDYVRGILADQKKILAAYTETVAAMARKFPARAFLVRPHPFEDRARYERAFDGLANVMVDPEGSVLNAIHHAAAVLHVNCGTSVEAVMLRRLPIAMEFLNTDRMRDHAPLPSRISFRVSSAAMLEETLGAVGAAASAFNFTGNYAEDIFPWFHHNDGGAAERVLDVVANVTGRRKGPSSSIRRALGASRAKSRAGQRLQAALANMVGSHAASGLRALWNPKRREKRFAVTKVASMLAALSQLEERGSPAVQRASHPLTGAALASVTIAP